MEKFITKIEAETDPEYGFEPEKRPINELIDLGIINLNKPSGPTSHQAADYVKKILKTKRAGHSGSLDPKVTGVLPIALNSATRINEFLLTHGKEYVAIMHLHKPAKESEIKKVIKEFTGKIKQLPPIRSAVKRQLREREIYYFELLEIKDQDILFKIGCQAGTYIRKICHDFGKKLGTNAHMSQLIRTKVNGFTDKNWCSFQDLKDAYEDSKEGDEKELRKLIFPIEFVVKDFKKIYVLDSTIDPLCHGAPLYCPGISKIQEGIQAGDIVAIMSLKDELISIAKANIEAHKMSIKDKDIAATQTKVFMKIGVYPKTEK